MGKRKITFDRSAVLRQGGFGAVYKGEFDGRPVAVVRLNKSNGNEEQSMLKLDHPNIVKLFRGEIDDEFRCYAIELCDASLDQLFLKSDDVKKYNGRMPHHIDGLLQLASGLEYIHSKNLVHGNIKPENVLIMEGSAGQDEITLKWTNFGLIRNDSDTRQTSPIGRNKVWLAPELLQLTKHIGNVDETSYPESAEGDIFALGLVFGSLFLNGEHLYGSTENEIADNIVNGNPINMQKTDGTLRDCYENDLLGKMLKNDPNERMKSKEVLVQLHTIKDKLTGKEKELLELCGRDSRFDLTGKIKELIQFGINSNTKDKDGRNALHLLCRYYSNPKLTDAIQLVVKGGIDVNARDSDRMNAIHYLCRYRSSQNLIDAIQILIQLGIDANAKSNDGSNGLHYLCRYNSTPNLLDAVGILIKFGMDVTLPDNAGWNALYYWQNKDKKEMKIWFDRENPIAEGGYGMVYKGKFGGREVAVKRVEIRRVNEIEKEAMLKLDHPNIVKLLHCETDNDFMNYALELCVASLDQLFLEMDHPKKYNSRMPRQIEVFHQLAKGLTYIHSNNLIHRDIKPHNILIMQDSEKHENIIMKWSDFGLAKSVNEKGYHSWSGVRGTRTWYAPEVLKKLINEEKSENDGFWGTVKSDVFVLGLVFGYIFLEGEHLFGSREKEIHDNIIGKDPVNVKNIDGEVRKYYGDGLLTKMLEYNPEKRISSKEVVKQLKSIKNQLNEKEEEFRQLCVFDSSPDLLGRINDFNRLGIDVNAKDKNGRNALHILCWRNSSPSLIDAIQLLIQLGIDVNAKDNDGMNALHHLCKSNSSLNLIDAIQLLIQMGIHVNAKSNWGRYALHGLCRSNSSPNLIDAIQLLTPLGIDVNAKDNDGMNALHHLCKSNSSPKLIDAIQLLIQLGIDVNAKDYDRWNALHHLCESNSSPNLTDAIQLLIQLGIDVNAKDSYGKRNALHYLCKSNSSPKLIDPIQLLIKLGIDVNAKDNLGKNSLHYLCRENSSPNLIDAIQLLIQLGNDVNAKDRDGWNALHHLCWRNSSPSLIDAIQLLIQLGIDVISNGRDARTFLGYNSKISNKDEILKLLDKALV